MKIAVSTGGEDLSSPVDPRFGRSPYFIFVDPETMEFEALENPNISLTSGAGIQSAQLVAGKGANVLLTGSCGPNAFQTLQAAGVQVIIGVTGTVEEVIEKYKSGNLQPSTQPNVSSHFGMGGGRGRGLGRGMGQEISQLSSKEEIRILKQQAQSLQEQIHMILKRIQDIEKNM